MQTDDGVQTMQWSSPCWEARALLPQVLPLISAETQRTELKEARCAMPGLDVHSDLHIRRDTRATAVHSLRGTPAVVAVVVTAGAVGCVHRHGDPAVQVAVSPAGHIAVRRLTEVWRQAGTLGS